jgi:DNA polymerase I-like protein with 3'-5' exonuclease and polymerase domains
MASLGLRSPDECWTFDIEYSGQGYSEQLEEIQELINQTNLIIGFNLKFDLAWCLRYGIDFSHCRVFDCQVAQFIISNQEMAWPSLQETAEYYGLEGKLDVVKTQFWDKGLDTFEVPWHILDEYLVQDLVTTEDVYKAQVRVLSSASYQQRRLVSLCNQDLLVLLEMEWNGVLLDFRGMEQASLLCNQQIEATKLELTQGYFADIPPSYLNFNSGDCLSAMLYGGVLKEEVRTEIGVYKTGDKIGLPRYSISIIEHSLPRRVEPPRGSELKKAGFFATNEETLRSIKGRKEDRVVLDKILELSKLEKLNGTYYKGLAKLHEERDWEVGIIHGGFNQCVARTGRLSSSSPNLQNFPGEMDTFTISRFT